MARTLQQLQTMIRRRMGWPSTDTFVTDAELRDMLQESQRELHDFLISSFGAEYLAGTMTLTIPANTNTNKAISGVAQISRVHRVSAIFDALSVPLHRMDLANEVFDRTAVTWDAGLDLRYRASSTLGSTLSGYLLTSFQFHPIPNTTQMVHLVLTPTPGTLSLSTATNLIGYDEYLVLDVMAKLKQMEDDDVSAVLAEKDRLKESIVNMSTPLDAAQPAVIGDSRSAEMDRADRSYYRWR